VPTFSSIGARLDEADDHCSSDQVHTFLSSNMLSSAGGIGYTQYGAGDSATVQYVNQSPPPSTVISIAGSTVTHRRVAENKL